MDTSTTNASASELSPSPVAEETKPRSPSLKPITRGLWLIVIGITWILWNMWVINWRWIESYGFVIFGVLLLTQTILSKKFRFLAGSWLVLIGAFHIFLAHSDVVRMRDVWPVYAIMTGMAFLIHFVANLQRWFSLVAAFLCTGLGAVYLSRTLFLLPYDVALMLQSYWPLSFVAAGCIMITLALWHLRKKNF